MTDDTFDPEQQDEPSFADLLEQSLLDAKPLEPGQKIEATVLQISDEWVFLDVGQKGEGVLDVKELMTPEGELELQVGDRLNVYFLSRRSGELTFTTRIGGGSSGTAQLEEAWRSGIPVDGRIEKEIKGGFEVRLPGNVRAFCPFSQSGLRRNDSNEALIGTTLSFKITRFEDQGRNLVVSHREIVEEERKQQRATLMETLKEGMVVTGTITNLRDFGAFVDIGGLEGLLPISEVSHSRTDDIHQVLSVGQQVEVAVKKIDWENEKFSFSLRDTLADPWARVGTVFAEGTTHTGTVAKLAPFGAFVTLDDGIDGLIHISRLGEGRHIKHPKEVLMVGQQLAVTIEKIDRAERRISLVPASAAKDDTQNSYVESGASSMGTFADLFNKARKDKS